MSMHDRCKLFKLYTPNVTGVELLLFVKEATPKHCQRFHEYRRNLSLETGSFS